jgi:hypothetical protein
LPINDLRTFQPWNKPKGRNLISRQALRPISKCSASFRLVPKSPELRDFYSFDSHLPLVAVTVNSATILLYWQIGNRIRKDVLGEERAEYGKQIVASLSRKLVKEYGEGLSPKNLSRMTRFC